MKFYPNKTIGIFFDLHDTLLKCRGAWLAAFRKVCRNIAPLELVAMYDSMSRKDMCEKLAVEYEQIKSLYNKKIRVNHAVFACAKKLSKSYGVYIVSNASRDRVVRDCAKIKRLAITRIYTKEDGIKPAETYFRHIMRENGLSHAIMIGDKPTEDLIRAENIGCVIILPRISSKSLMEMINIEIQRLLYS